MCILCKMSVNNHRKCAKCGRTRAEDTSVTYHRFPNPGTTNITKAHAWAKYCWPNKDWTSVEFLYSLHITNKVLCGRHFNSTQFYDNKRQKLGKFAVPDPTEVEELLNNRKNIKPEVSLGEDTDVMDFESDVNISKDRVTMESHPEVPDVAVLFTWHNPSEVIDSGVKDDAQYIGTEIMTDDVLLYNDGKSTAIDTCEIINQDVSTNEGNVSSQREKQLQYHKEYKCNHCSGPIEGFRYRCVQCADYDQCAACEARGAHERHYVLRIPGPRPYAEIEAVLQKIKAELLSGSHSVLLEDTQMLDSVKEEIKDEEQDPLVVDPTNPINPLFGDADDTQSEVMSNVSESDKAESEQQGYGEDNDFKRTKWKSNDSACEQDNSIHRDNLQTYSSKRQNSSNKKLILDNRTQKLDEKSHNLDNRKFLITKPGDKYVAIKNIEIVEKTVNIVPNKLSDPKVLVTRLKPLTATGAVQSPTGSQLPGIPLKQISTATVHPSNKPSTPNILKKTPIVIKKLSD